MPESDHSTGSYHFGLGPAREQAVPLSETVPATDPQGTVDHIPAPDGTSLVQPAKKEFPAVPGYEIMGELGRGGMGVVYKALHLRLKRTVALKMVLAGSHASPEQLSRFNQEAQAVAQLQHAHIVQI